MLNKPRIALFIGIICISIFPVIVKMELTSGLISAFYRMFIPATLVLPYAIITKKLKKVDFKTSGFIVLAALFFGTDIAVWNIAIQGSSATQATLLTNLAPVWVGIGSYFFLKLKPSINFWIGTFFALIGMVVFVGLDIFLNLSFDIPFGLAILSGILYAFYILLSKKILEKTDVLTFMTYSLTISSAYLAIINVINGSTFTGFSIPAWSSLLIQGLICQLLAWFLISYATQHMRATRVSLSLLAQVVLASLLAWIFLNESITQQMIVGGIIILLGIGITFIDKPLIKRPN